MSRVGGGAIRGFTDSASSFAAQERKLGAAVSAGVLGVSLLGLRHPRLVTWPLGVAGVLAGGLGLLSAALRESSEEDAAQDALPP